MTAPAPFPVELGEMQSETAAACMGVSVRTIERWVENGIRSVFIADEWAWKVMGVHPLAVWPNWLDDLVGREELTLFDDL